MSDAQPTLKEGPDGGPQQGPSTADSLPSAVQEQIETLCRGFVEKLRGDYQRVVNATLEQSEKEIVEARANSFQTLSEALRRIRAEDSVTAIATALVDTAVLFCGRAVLLINKGERMLGFRSAGAGKHPDSDALQKLTFDTGSAVSIAHAIGSLDTVVASGSAGNVSAEMVEAFDYHDDDEVRVYPLRLRDKVLAVVIVDDAGENAIESAAIEALLTTAEAWIEAVGSRRKAAANRA